MSKTESKFKGTFRAPPPLPLVPVVFEKKEREKCVAFKLHSVPTDKDSPKIECQIQKINGSETLREGIKFFQDLDVHPRRMQPYAGRRYTQDCSTAPNGTCSQYICRSSEQGVHKLDTTNFAMKQSLQFITEYQG